MTKRRIAILIFVFLNTFCVAFSYYVMKASDEKCTGSKYYFKVSFDARISSENFYGELKNSDGTWGKEVQIPVQTKVHVTAVRTGEMIGIETPVMVEIEGDSQAVYLDFETRVPMDDIDKSAYAKDLLQSKMQENQQNIDSKIRNHLIISIIAGVILFSVFSCVFLFIEKKCTTGRIYKCLFAYLFITTIQSLLLTCFFYDYIGHCK